jgi:hypothetical protein
MSPGPVFIKVVDRNLGTSRTARYVIKDEFALGAQNQQLESSHLAPNLTVHSVVSPEHEIASITLSISSQHGFQGYSSSCGTQAVG